MSSGSAGSSVDGTGLECYGVSSKLFGIMNKHASYTDYINWMNLRYESTTWKRDLRDTLKRFVALHSGWFLGPEQSHTGAHHLCIHY